MRAFLALLAAVILAEARPVPAHKFHNSLTELEFNRSAGSIEVAIQLFADDLEVALERRFGRPVRVDSGKAAEAAVHTYVQEVFEIKGPTGRPVRLDWVGMEIKTDSVWVYVESPLTEGLNGAVVRSRQFFEIFDDQVNVVSLRDGKMRADLVFRPGDAFKIVLLRERN